MGNSGKEQVIDYVEMMIETAFEVRYGSSKEDAFREIDEMKRKNEEEQRKNEEAHRKIEEEQRKIEGEQRKIEEEQRKIEEEQRKIEEERRKSILTLHLKLNLSAAEIASTLGLDLASVKSILEQG